MFEKCSNAAPIILKHHIIMPDVQTKFSGKKRKAPIPSKRMKAWTIIIPPVHTDICFSVNGEIPSLLTVTFRQCNSGVIFGYSLLTTDSHYLRLTEAFKNSYCLHQRFCGHIIYLTMRIHYKVLNFPVSSVFSEYILHNPWIWWYNISLSFTDNTDRISVYVKIKEKPYYSDPLK